jgi:hypothetical protein
MTNAALEVTHRTLPPFTLPLSSFPCPPVSHVPIYTAADKTAQHTAAASVIVLTLPASDKDRMKY